MVYLMVFSDDAVFCRPGRPQAERVFVARHELWSCSFEVRIYDLGKTFLTRWPNMWSAYLQMFLFAEANQGLWRVPLGS